MSIVLTWAAVVYLHCGAPMDWDALRALYVCGTCGATR